MLYQEPPRKTRRAHFAVRPCAPVRWRTHIALVPAILHPLPYVAQHVMQDRIAFRRERAGGRRVHETINGRTPLPSANYCSAP